jgi:hypothetical protein
MTVINTNYSTLDEAWGNGSFERAITKKKKKTVDPLCELYKKKAVKPKKPFQEADIDPYSYKGDLYGPHSKVSYSRTLKPQDEPICKPRKQVKPVVSIDGGTIYAGTDEPLNEDDDDLYLANALEARSASSEVSEDDEQQMKASNMDRYLKSRGSNMTIETDYNTRDKFVDFGLYIASGVMLIFMMEQVLQLGMRMK